jgi:hypothetical protein
MDESEIEACGLRLADELERQVREWCRADMRCVGASPRELAVVGVTGASYLAARFAVSVAEAVTREGRRAMPELGEIVDVIRGAPWGRMVRNALARRAS